MKKYLETGKIVGTHGVRGEVRVQAWADSLEFLCQFKKLYLENGKTCLDILSARPSKNVVLMKIKGVDTIEQANLFRNKVIFLDRNDVSLPDGSFFIQDLIGLDVTDADNGMRYGTLSDVSQTGANDVYHITDDNGKETLIAAVPSVVIDIDPEGGFVKIRPLEGTFDDED